LSREYTNHSVRATSVTILDCAGFQACHIMAVSGHKSESCIRSYASKTSSNVKHVMSDSFSNALRTQDIQPPQTPSVHTARPMPDLELLPQKWIEWFESDSEQPATSAALTVQQPQCTNKTVNRDTVRRSQSQFSFYNCNVTLTNVNN